MAFSPLMTWAEPVTSPRTSKLVAAAAVSLPAATVIRSASRNLAVLFTDAARPRSVTAAALVHPATAVQPRALAARM